MQPRRSNWLWVLLAILLLLAAAGGIWANLKLAEKLPGGEEFLVNWYAIRSWITEGNSPYNPAVRLETEVLYYGHPARAGEPRLTFFSPLFSAILFFPFALIENYPLARAIWMLVLELALVATLWISVTLTGWKPSLPTWLLLVVSIWGGSVSLYSIQAGSPAAVVIFLFVLGLSALRSNRLEVAGLLFALAAGLPHAAPLALLFIVMWTVSTRKGTTAVWFISGIIFMSIIGLFFIQDWPLQFLRTIIAHARDQVLLTPGALMREWWPGVGRQLGWGMTILVVLVLGVEWLQAHGKDYRWFFWTLSLTLVLEMWSGIPMRLTYLVVLLPALVVIVANWEQRLGVVGKWLSFFALLILLVGQWAMMGGILGELDANRSMLFLEPFLILTGLYWIRWWAIRPARLLVEELRSAGY